MGLLGPLLGSAPRSARSVEPEERGSGGDPSAADLALRVAKLEEECKEYKAGYDRVKGLVDRLEKLEAKSAESEEKSLADRLQTLEAKTAEQEKKLAAAASGLAKAEKVDGQDVEETASPEEKDTDADEKGCLLSSSLVPSFLRSSEKDEQAPDMKRSDSDYFHGDFKTYPIPLAESIYTDFVLTWARGHVCPIMTSTLLCFACIAVQCLFIDMIANFSERDILEQQKSTAIWGDHWTHLEKNGTASLFSRKEYCNGTAWSWEADSIESFSKYLKPHWISYLWGKLFQSYLSRGRLLCSLALLLWSANCLAELRDIIEFLSLLSLPHRGWDDGQAYEYIDTKDAGKLVGLGWQSRTAVVVVAAFRLAIISTLFYYGRIFLLYTTGLVDFILNALALAFVLDIDDICFRFLSPAKQRAVRSLTTPVMDGCTARVFHFFAPIAELIPMAFIFTSLYFAFEPLMEVEIAVVGNSIQLCSWDWLDNISREAEQITTGS